MNEIHALDFNNRSNINPRFSTTRVKQQLKNEDIQTWATLIAPPQQGMYAYPASLELAIIHQQSCYLLPDMKFLIENPNVQQCDCCGQRIRRRRVKYQQIDLYDYLVPEYGICIPLYFTFLKLHIFLLIFIGLVFGVYFSYYSHLLCNNPSMWEKYVTDKEDHHPICKHTDRFFFIPQDDFLFYLHQKGGYQLILYYSLAFAVYLVMMITPFIHEIIIRAKQIRYWQYDPWNHIRFDKLSLYVKHLPRKMTEAEVQQSIYNALTSSKKVDVKASVMFQADFTAIDELLYIYDTHPIKLLNQKRQSDFLQLLIVAQQIKDASKEQELASELQPQGFVSKDKEDLQAYRDKFTSLVSELMIQTKEIQMYLKQGLPYTNKIILKLKTEDQAQAIFNHYKKGVFSMIKSRIKVLWMSRRQLKEQEERRISQMNRDSLISSDAMSSASQEGSVKTSSDIQRILPSKSAIMGEKSSEMGSSQPIMKIQKAHTMTVIDLIDSNNDVELAAALRLKEQRQVEIDEGQKDIHVSRGFREDDIFWENIGMHTLKRFFLRLFTFIVSIIASILTMGLFETLFYFQNTHKQKGQGLPGPDNQAQSGNDLKESILINFITLLIVFLAVLSAIIVLVTTIRSRRSTYTLQEMNIINFLSFTSLVLVLSFPYFLVLLAWKGLERTLPVYNLVLLGRIRIAFKGITHIFHVRSCGFWCRRRKIIKKFNKYQYFQSQLNTLMTPGMFPLRSRLLFAFFVFSTGYLMIFLAPWILLLCLIFQIFFYYFDKFSLFKVYAIDKQFTFPLMKYLVSSQLINLNQSYQIIMTPIYTFIYFWIFRPKHKTYMIDQNSISIDLDMTAYNIGYVGLGIGVLSWLTFICFKKQIANFWTFRIMRLKKPIRNADLIFEEKTYFDSYQKYFESLGIEALDEALVGIFNSLEIKRVIQ